MKTQILAALGENGMQQASAVNAGLAANDRIKYAFSLLQMAIEHAQYPKEPPTSLKRERLAAGIDDPDLDATVSGARQEGSKCRIPGASRILERMGEDMGLMAAPVLAAPGQPPKASSFGTACTGCWPPAPARRTTSSIHSRSLP